VVHDQLSFYRMKQELKKLNFFKKFSFSCCNIQRGHVLVLCQNKTDGYIFCDLCAVFVSFVVKIRQTELDKTAGVTQLTE